MSYREVRAVLLFHNRPSPFLSDTRNRQGELFVYFLLIDEEGNMRGLQTKRDHSTKSAPVGNKTWLACMDGWVDVWLVVVGSSANETFI